eukprot:10404913-Karenia_brevis.AAC.1
MEIQGQPTYREDLPVPAAGLPTDPRYARLQHELPRDPEYDSDFDTYIAGFLWVADHLRRIRAPWLERAPIDDLMKYDEAALRNIECIIIRDLQE